MHDYIFSRFRMEFHDDSYQIRLNVYMHSGGPGTKNCVAKLDFASNVPYNTLKNYTFIKIILTANIFISLDNLIT